MAPRRAPGDNGSFADNGADFAREFLQTLQGLMQQAPPQENIYGVIEQFRKMGPPRLKGNEGPENTEEWIRELERIFELMACTEEQRVSCAIFQLAEEASYWWESHTRVLTPEQRQAMKWEDFKGLIMKRYFTESYKTQKETEFLNLKQGSMTVVNYERKFNQLSRYAPYLVDTDEKKARRFEGGLRPEIAGILAGLRLPTYGEVIDRAQAISNGLQLELNDQKQIQRDAFGKRKWEEPGKGKNVPPNKKWQPTTGFTTNRANEVGPQCPKCKRAHFGESRFGKNVCYSCGEPGHMSFNCPRKKKELERKNMEGERKVKPRFFAMAENEDDRKGGADTC